MPRSALAPLLPLWSAAYFGCAVFLVAGLFPRGPASPALLAQLAWLALIGSVPTALVLGSAASAARARPSVIAAVAVVVGLLGLAVGWDHTDFVLSGPRWAMHPRRDLARAALGFAFGLASAAGWLWLVGGLRIDRRSKVTAWIAVTVFGVALLTATIARYRAYDYSMAQAVFPGGALCAALTYRVAQVPRGPGLLLSIAGVCTIFAIVSRLHTDCATTGEREVIAHSRAGALVTLYVLPHLDPQETWSDTAPTCPATRWAAEQSPIGIAPEARRNVVIITVDALRKDLVDATVRGTLVTPELSKLARRGMSFENATTTYPATLYALGSAFTGLSPAELYLSPALPETIFTRSRGLVDRQLVILPDVRWFRLPIVEELFAPGADKTFARSDAAATRMLVEQLRGARSDGASVMAWIHYYSPHDPYQAHLSFPFGKGRKNAYLSEVAYFDRELGALMEYLRDDGWLEDTLVVFFSDHGEAIGENKGYFGHHVYLDGWMVDVPLVLWHSSLSPARPRVGVTVADVAPTVLHFLGLPQPVDLAARSLFTLDPNAANRATFSEAFPVRGEALFQSFRLPALDDATIRERLRSIRVASKGYEPKGAITRDRQRLIHHRSADASFVYQRDAASGDVPLSGAEAREVSKLLRGELDSWEREQLRRIQCRLRVTAEDSETLRR